MRAKDKQYVADIIKKFKYIAHDNAVRSQGNDSGFSVGISPDNIRTGTSRERLKIPLLESLSDELEEAGFSAEIDADEKSINVFVPPVLGKKEEFTLDEIEERVDVVEEISTREAYYFANN